MVVTPSLGVAHPLKIGKTLRSSGRKTRNILALKFPHVPYGTDTSVPGQLVRTDDKLTVELATADGESTQVFSGPRKVQTTGSRMSEYALVFYDGAFWLERIADYGNCVRHDGLSSNPMEIEQQPEDSLSEDPDSWMMKPEDLSGSPIKPHGDLSESCAIKTSSGSASRPPLVKTGFGGKGLQSTLHTNVASDERDSRTVDEEDCYEEKNVRSGVAAKRLALKWMATKAPPSMVQAAPNEISGASQDNAEIIEVEIVKEEVDVGVDEKHTGNAATNPDGNGDDSYGEDSEVVNEGEQESSSSSSEDSGSGSDSESDSDCSEFTDSSSDAD